MFPKPLPSPRYPMTPGANISFQSMLLVYTSHVGLWLDCNHVHVSFKFHTSGHGSESKPADGMVIILDIQQMGQPCSAFPLH